MGFLLNLVRKIIFFSWTLTPTNLEGYLSLFSSWKRNHVWFKNLWFLGFFYPDICLCGNFLKSCRFLRALGYKQKLWLIIFSKIFEMKLFIKTWMMMSLSRPTVFCAVLFYYPKLYKKMPISLAKICFKNPSTDLQKRLDSFHW